MNYMLIAIALIVILLMARVTRRHHDNLRHVWKAGIDGYADARANKLCRQKVYNEHYLRAHRKRMMRLSIDVELNGKPQVRVRKDIWGINIIEVIK